MLGGRAAEEIVYGTRTTGAENDIEQATQSRAQHGHALGHERRARHGAARAARRTRTSADGWIRRREAIQRGDRRAPIDAEVQRIIDECHAEGEASADAAIARSSTRWSQALLARETLDEQEILEVTGLPPAPDLSTRPLPEGAADVNPLPLS